MQFEKATALVKAALPEGWHAGPLAINRRLDYREPIETWECEFHWGVPIEGGRTMHYAGKSDTRETYRRVDVRVTAKDPQQLADFARLLPDLARLAALPWPLEFHVEGYPFPD